MLITPTKMNVVAVGTFSILLSGSVDAAPTHARITLFGHIAKNSLNLPAIPLLPSARCENYGLKLT